MKDDNLNMKEREVGGLRFGYGLNVHARNTTPSLGCQRPRRLISSVTWCKLCGFDLRLDQVVVIEGG